MIKTAVILAEILRISLVFFYKKAWSLLNPGTGAERVFPGYNNLCFHFTGWCKLLLLFTRLKKVEIKLAPILKLIKQAKIEIKPENITIHILNIQNISVATDEKLSPKLALSKSGSREKIESCECDSISATTIIYQWLELRGHLIYIFICIYIYIYILLSIYLSIYLSI